jgi:uncharacterized membrane protein YgdD (TMEM256/DUF423 family)
MDPTLPSRPSRWMTFAAGLLGATGVAAAAAAAHAGGRADLLATASAMSLAHAPVILAIALAGHRLRLARPAAALLAFGAILFSSDLWFHAFEGVRLFPMAAPIGGTAMILGWAVVVISALLPDPER